MKRISIPLIVICCFFFRINAQDKPSPNPNANTKVSGGEKAIKAMLPPQLSYPANESEIEILNPVLIWIPPSPINGMQVTYSLRLVEIQKGQTLAEALLQNPPMINLSSLSNTFLNYPVDATPLHVNGHYAWQVAASCGGQSLGVTDMWSFTVKKNETQSDDDIIYPFAAKTANSKFYVSHGIFRFAYNNKNGEASLSYKLHCMGDNMKAIPNLPTLKLMAGVNKLALDLRDAAALKENQYYYLEITDSKGQVYTLTYYYLKK